MKNEFMAIIEQDEESFTAHCPEIPGANGEGKTKDEACERLAEAIAMILEDRRGEAVRLMTPGAIQETITVEGAPSVSTPIPPPPSPDVPDDVSSTEVLSVNLLKKQFDVQDYEEFIWFDIEFTATGLDKPARAIKGVLNLQDLFGESPMAINLTLDEPLTPGEKVVRQGTGFEYNQFLDSHRWVLATDLQNMAASFTVMSVLYQDGTRRDF